MGNFSEPWGKISRETGARHHLAHHCMDVAAVFEALLGLKKIQACVDTAAGGKAPLAALSGWAYLHDAGKLAPGFQAKGWAGGTRRAHPDSHLAAGWEWLSRRGREGRPAWARQLDWCSALMAHHGRPVEPVRGIPAAWPVHTDYDWRDAEARLLDGFTLWFQDADAALPEAPRLVNLAAGLLSLADWIGSDTRWFKPVPNFDRDYGAKARVLAAQAVAEIGLDVSAWRPAVAPEFSELTGYEKANSAQRAVNSVDESERLIILEAETGSGKTEAAVWRFARLFAAGEIDALYFALPTRAAARQVQARLSHMLRGWLPGSPGVTLAIPGQRQVDDDVGYRLPGWLVKWAWDEIGGRRWAAEHATRFLAAPIAVGTVDQAMMAALSVKHAPMRAAALSRSLLVIDEVHASDAYMTGIIRHLLDDHVALGGHAMLMSATLGSAARSRWLGQPLPAREAAEAEPYPAVWTGRDRIFAEGAGEKAVAISTRATMAAGDVAARAIEAADGGARVLILRNTVSAARETWEVVRQSRTDLLLHVNGRPTLHHARFAAEDRKHLDDAVERTLGKTSAQKPAIVIGTQTLEQALDIDADFLLTDLCPVDVLLQRIGRLHRHKRTRPAGFEEPRAEVMLPDCGLDALSQPRFENGLGAWDNGGIQGIYTNLPALEATRREIEARGVWHIPAMNRTLVEAVTHDDALDRITHEMGWQAYYDAVLARNLAARQLGAYAAYRKDVRFHEAFRPFDDETALRTRLGAEGAIYDLPPETTGPFGLAVTRISLPAHWSKGLTGDEEVQVDCADDVLTLRVGDRGFIYDTGGLRKEPA